MSRHMRTVCQIISLEPDMMALSNDDLAAKTGEFRERLRNGKTLDDILPEAFAVVREASRRVLSMRHYDVQLVGPQLSLTSVEAIYVCHEGCKAALCSFLLNRSS